MSPSSRTRAVRDQRLIGESGALATYTVDLDDPGDHIEIAGQIGYGRQAIERRDPAHTSTASSTETSAPTLPTARNGAIHQRQLAGGIDQVVEPHGRHVGRNRRRRPLAGSVQDR